MGTDNATVSDQQINWRVESDITWPTSSDAIIIGPTGFADYVAAAVASAARAEYGSAYKFAYTVPATGAVVDFVFSFTSDINSGEPVLQAFVSSFVGAGVGYIVGTLTLPLTPALQTALAAGASYMAHKLVDAAFNGKLGDLFTSIGSGMSETPPTSPSLFYSLNASPPLSSPPPDLTSPSASFYCDAGSTPPPPRIDPLVLDLNGDGITTTSVNRFGAHFDMDGNGFAESVGWVSAEDGILVRDLSGGARMGECYLGSRGICSHMPTSVSNSPVSGM